MSPTTFIITYNPSKWPESEIQILINSLLNGETVIERWKFGSPKICTIGDRVFLSRVGAIKSGMIGSGFIVSAPRQEANFEDPDKLSWYVDIQFDFLSPTPDTVIIDHEELSSILNVDKRAFTPQQSGVSFKGDQALLEDIWKSRTAKNSFEFKEETTSNKPMFVFGEAYTRGQIHEELGGSVQSFLPTVNGEVICACLSKDMNPNAPHEILVGNKPIVLQSAEQFITQSSPVPVFIKEASNEWIYAGDYFVKKATHRNEGIDKYDLAGRDDIQFVLELERSQQSGTHRNPKWTRDELILALELYFREPVSHGNASHSEVIKLSDLLNFLPIHKDRNSYEKFRNANGVGMKLANFRSFDPDYDEGLSKGSKLDKEVWDDFSGNIEQLKQVAEAIKDNYKEVSSAEELDDDIEATEGRILTRIHQKRERCVKLVRKKKEQVFKKTGKLECEACGFDYEKMYGKHGSGFAECHHTKPVSEIKDIAITKLSDLAIVCANCHRMIHKSKPWLSISALQSIVR